VRRPVRDIRHFDFRGFTKNLQIYKRELREVEPEAVSHETGVIHSDAEQQVVMAFLLARQADEKQGNTAATTAFARNRQHARMLREILARIPIPDGRVVNQ